MGLDMGLASRPKEKTELTYWRKANQIREWFVNNLEDFHDEGESKVEKEDIEDLLDVCKKVLDNHELAPELLPVSEGFFFGSNEYDEWYFEQIEETVESLTSILSSVDWENEDVYYWEWY